MVDEDGDGVVGCDVEKGVGCEGVVGGGGIFCGIEGGGVGGFFGELKCEDEVDGGVCGFEEVMV